MAVDLFEPFDWGFSSANKLTTLKPCVEIKKRGMLYTFSIFL